jgi:hypothetical protein
MSYRGLALVCLLAACAEAGKEQTHLGGPDGGNTRPDSGGNQLPDAARLPDASGGHGTQTLSETTSSADSGAAIACGDGATYTARNSYYRVFALSDYSITNAFSVSKVDFVVSLVSGAPALKVSVGSYTGTPGGATLSTGSMSLMANKTLTPGAADTSESVSLTATIPAGGNVLVEIDQTNDGSINGDQFYIGANAGGESKPGYISSPDCTGAATPTSMSQVAAMPADMIVTVTGSY